MRKDNLNEDEWYQKSIDTFQECKFEQAEYYFNKILGTNPSDIDVL